MTGKAYLIIWEGSVDLEGFILLLLMSRPIKLSDPAAKLEPFTVINSPIPFFNVFFSNENSSYNAVSHFRRLHFVCTSRSKSRKCRVKDYVLVHFVEKLQ